MHLCPLDPTGHWAPLKGLEVVDLSGWRRCLLASRRQRPGSEADRTSECRFKLIIWGYIGIMENLMETTIEGYGFRV